MTPSRAPGATVDADRLVRFAALAQPSATADRARSLSGGRSGPRRGGGGDPYDLRPFQEGDDPRRIDPAATARSGRPQVRSRHEEVDHTLLLVADFRSSMLWGTRGRFRSVAAAEALALEGWRAVLAGGRVGAMILRDRDVETLPPRARHAAMLAVCGALARVHATACDGVYAAPESLAACLERVSTAILPGTSVCLATGLDDPGETFATAAAALMQKGRLEVLLVQDAVEMTPPAGTFTARVGLRVARGRFGASSSSAVLEAAGIPVRIVDATVLPGTSGST